MKEVFLFALLVWHNCYSTLEKNSDMKTFFYWGDFQLAFRLCHMPELLWKLNSLMYMHCRPCDLSLLLPEVDSYLIKPFLTLGLGACIRFLCLLLIMLLALDENPWDHWLYHGWLVLQPIRGRGPRNWRAVELSSGTGHCAGKKFIWQLRQKLGIRNFPYWAVNKLEI